jgi:enoyl-CoA hydratase
MSDAVLIDGRGTSVWTVTLNNPASRNAVDEVLQPALLACVVEAASDQDIRAMVITGSGSVFSAGGDFGLIHRMQSDGALRHRTFELSRDLYSALINLEIPVVGAVNGSAIGAGCTLALLCDVVVMSKSATLGDPRIKLNLVSGDGGAILWPIMAGLPAARLHLMLGDVMDAEEAYRIGMVSRVVEPDALLAEARSLAQQLARIPRSAMRETKRILNASISSADSEPFERALHAEEEAFDTQEHLDAVANYEESLKARRNGE